MKKLFTFLAVLTVAAVATVWAAETYTTVTNRGQVITVKKYTDLASSTANTEVYQDNSEYAVKAGQKGRIVRFYDYDKQGGAATTYKLQPAIAIPDGAIIEDGFVQVLTAIAPIVGSTQALTLESAADLKAAETNNFSSTGLKTVIPVGDVATAVSLTADRYVQITFGGAVTAGKLMVVLDYTYAP